MKLIVMVASLAFSANIALANNFEVLRCTPGLPPNNGLFAAISAQSLKSDYSNLNLFINHKNDNVLTCGSYKDGTRYGIGYFRLSFESDALLPEPLKALAPFDLIKSNYGGNYDGTHPVPPVTFGFKKFNGNNSFEILSMQVNGSLEYTVFSCIKEFTPYTNKVCLYTDGLDMGTDPMQ